MDRANELIKKMLYAGMSRLEIANKLGVTKNSIVGRVHRMKKAGQLPNFEDNKPSEPTRKQRVEREKERKHRKRPAASKRFKIDENVEWETSPVKITQDRKKVGRFICELEKPSDCRFAVGRYDGQHTF